jgi:hypothetical protein
VFDNVFAVPRGSIGYGVAGFEIFGVFLRDDVRTGIEV